MNHRLLIAASVCALVLGAASIHAQQATPRGQQDTWQDQTRSESQKIEGIVEGMRIVQADDQQRHLVLRVQSEDARRGRYEFVDLGEAQALRDRNIQLNRGTDVEATGRRGEINGRSVLVAEEVTIAGRRHALDTKTARQMGRAQEQDRFRTPGQRQQDWSQQRGEDFWEDESRSQRTGQTKEIRGTIEDLRIVQTQDQERHLVLRIQSDEARRGEYEFVDLGKAEDVRTKDIRVNRGTTIRASGQQDQINGRTVLVADEITVEGQRYALDTTPSRQTGRYQQEQERYQSQREQQRGMDRMRQRDPQMHDSYKERQELLQRYEERGESIIRGEVVSMRDFSIEGIDEKHRLIKVSDARDSRRSWVVDLGPTSATQHLDLQEGDQVLVQGQTGRLEGRPVMRATQIAEMIDLERGTAQRQRSQTQQQTLEELRESRQQQSAEQQSARAQQQRQQDQQQQPSAEEEQSERGDTDSMRSRIGKPKTGSDNTPSTQDQFEN